MIVQFLLLLFVIKNFRNKIEIKNISKVDLSSFNKKYSSNQAKNNKYRVQILSIYRKQSK